jgi:DNA-binding response OmpR family regulator
MTTKKESTRILLLEDHPLHREMVVDELQDSGFDVRAAKDTASVRKMIRDFKPDLLLFDIMLYGNKIEVAELVRDLRATLPLRDVPVLFVTAYPDVFQDLVEGISNSQVLKKPFDFEELKVTMRRMILR